jgi:hypothetical protein
MNTTPQSLELVDALVTIAERYARHADISIYLHVDGLTYVVMSDDPCTDPGYHRDLAAAADQFEHHRTETTLRGGRFAFVFAPLPTLNYLLS